MQEIFEKAAAEQIPFWKVVLETDVEQRQVTEEQSMEKMGLTWQAMLESVTTYQGEERSRSGLVGGDGAKMRAYVQSGKTICGDYIGQAIALCPGVSRSGMTITTGCFVGFERKFAVRFSFILSIPAILGANILSIKDAVDAGINWSEMPMYLAGVAVAAVTGYLCIRLLKMIADRGRFGAFAYYCWTVGALVLIFTIV